ncbi:transporter, hydrophobe/amphiphile efflux-1 (HAE1) family [Synechococcus sp. JA-2-3B'a(2-13)]|uniref:efflux RND transporter permease subunit n=1 Tax=Synechococcus sp. (strain JA-2-3B'a(2-13)) TaxID=321332 RepID=UPI0000694C1B|nr:multidrug efflux RND transporter permease subunit [Synechococcus sp. JA-2-3B'a(2-13)]ABD01702.1 transporter, hydrophobe/amphiphile efflux-1 (HAE1) family [Synechococcus sp. JA-2-3B'a(2-13)]
MFVDFFIRRPVFASVCSILIVLVGAVSIPLLPVDYYPQVAPPAVRVTAVYPGANAETVETAVTNVLEQEINGVEGIRSIASVSSSNGTSQITVTFSPDRDLDTAAVDVQNRVARAQGRLPAEVIQNGISVEKAGDSAFVLVLALRSEAGEYDELFLSNYAELFVRDALRRIRGVSDVIIFGERTYAMRIWLDPTRLASYGLTALDVVNAVRQQNIQVPAGQIGGQPSPPDQEFQISVQATGRLSQPEEFAQIVLKANADGSLVRIADVGRVELGAQSYDTFFRIGGQEAVGIAITQQPDANALEVSRQVRQTLAQLAESFPPGLIYEIPFDATLFITESVQEVIFTLLQAIGLVVLVLFIFLQDWRVTLIPTVTIPVALLGTFAFVRLFGFSINTLTLFGLTLATGLVVDDTIVVVENISRYIRDRGMRPLQGASAGMNEVLGAVIATTLVLLGLFVPVAFFPGTSGRIYQQFAVTIAVSVSLSTFNAITLAPALSALLIRPRSEQMFWLLRWFDRAVEGIRAAYCRLLELVVKLRLLVVTGFIACLGLTYWLFQVVPTGFVPDEDQGFFITIVQGPPGVSLHYTDGVIRQATAVLEGIPEIENRVIVGGFSFTGPSPGNGLIFATLKPWEERRQPEQSAQAIVNRLFGPFLGGISRALVIPILPPAIPNLGVAGGFTFQLQDRGVNDFNLLEQTANTLFFVGNSPPPPGQPPLGLQINPPTFNANSPQLEVQVDREMAQLLGIPLLDVFGTLQTLLGGTYVNDFDLFNRNYRVYVQADQAFRGNPESIGQFYVRGGQGQLLPLSTLVQVEETTSPAIINHFNLFRSVEIQGSALPGFSSGQAIRAMETLAAQLLPQGFGFEWSGLSLEEIESGGQAPLIFALGSVFVFLVLAAQFESYVDPLIILLAVPLAVLGALLAQLLRGLTNDVFCQVGLVMLIGLASKNSILIVEFANQLVAQGIPLVKAAVQAAETRFRAILMTALSTILGIFPLAVASGAGAASRQSLGTAVIGGMFVSTMLSLLVVPVLYVVIKGIQVRILGGSPSPVDLAHLPPPEDPKDLLPGGDSVG